MKPRRLGRTLLTYVALLLAGCTGSSVVGEEGVLRFDHGSGGGVSSGGSGTGGSTGGAGGGSGGGDGGVVPRSPDGSLSGDPIDSRPYAIGSIASFSFSFVSSDSAPEPVQTVVRVEGRAFVLLASGDHGAILGAVDSGEGCLVVEEPDGRLVDRLCFRAARARQLRFYAPVHFALEFPVPERLGYLLGESATLYLRAEDGGGGRLLGSAAATLSFAGEPLARGLQLNDEVEVDGSAHDTGRLEASSVDATGVVDLAFSPPEALEALQVRRQRSATYKGYTLWATPVDRSGRRYFTQDCTWATAYPDEYSSGHGWGCHLFVNTRDANDVPVLRGYVREDTLGLETWFLHDASTRDVPELSDTPPTPADCFEAPGQDCL